MWKDKEKYREQQKLFRKLVQQAIIATHCHKEAIDGAVVIARAIGYCFHCYANTNVNANDKEKPKGDEKKEEKEQEKEKEKENENIKNCQEFDVNEMFDLCLSDDLIVTEIMKSNIRAIYNFYQNELSTEEKNDPFITDKDIKFLENIMQYESEEHNTNDKNIKNTSKKKIDLLDFQIRSSEAVPLVLYCVARWYCNPVECIANCVSLGGDNDTTASMVGGIMGALYGTYWIPKRWFDNIENDYATDIQIKFEQEKGKGKSKKNDKSILQKMNVFSKKNSNDDNDIDDNSIQDKQMAFGRDLIQG